VKAYAVLSLKQKLYFKSPPQRYYADAYSWKRAEQNSCHGKGWEKVMGIQISVGCAQEER